MTRLLSLRLVMDFLPYHLGLKVLVPFQPENYKEEEKEEEETVHFHFTS